MSEEKNLKHKVIYNLARSWASMDGKLQSFLEGERLAEERVFDPAGHYVGYMEEASILLEDSGIENLIYNKAKEDITNQLRTTVIRIDGGLVDDNIDKVKKLLIEAADAIHVDVSST